MTILSHFEIDENDFLCNKLKDKNECKFDEIGQEIIKENLNDTNNNNEHKINKKETYKLMQNISNNNIKNNIIKKKL